MMKRSLLRAFSGMLTLCLLMSLNSGFAFAAAPQPDEIQSSDYLDSYMASTNFYNGKVVVTVDVDAVVYATMIGARDIYLYESTDGTHFTCVKHYNYLSYPNMMGSGWSYARDAVEDYTAVSGRYYYALVYVYAGNSTGYDSRPYATATIP